MRGMASGGIARHMLLTSALDEGHWSAPCPSCFIPDRRNPPSTVPTVYEPGWASWYEHHGEKKNLFPLLENRLWFLGYTACDLVMLPVELLQLQHTVVLGMGLQFLGYPVCGLVIIPVELLQLHRAVVLGIRLSPLVTQPVAWSLYQLNYCSCAVL